MRTETDFLLTGPFNRLNDAFFKGALASPLRKHITIAFLNAVMSQFERLLFYFGNVGGKTMGQALMEEIAKNDPIVADLLDFEKAFRSDPLMVRQYIMAERAHIDYLENLKCEREEGLEEGRNEGREEGRNEERIDTIRNMRSKGAMADEQIAYILNLPLEFVKSV